MAPVPDDHRLNDDGTVPIMAEPQRLGAPCVCGIYNLDRSDVLLRERAAPRKGTPEG